MPLQLSINYPENIPDALNTTRGEFEEEAKMAMAIKLYEMKRLSSGMAADLLGMNRVTFLMTLHRYGVPAIDLEAEELLEDVKNA